MTIDPIFFEKAIIKILFTNIELRDKIMPFIMTDVFTDFDCIKLVESIINHNKVYNRMPTVNDMSLIINDQDLYNKYISFINMDTSQFDDKFLKEKIGRWFKSKLMWNSMANAVKLLNDDKIEEAESLPEEIRTALSFSFDTGVGTDLFRDARKIYENLTATDLAISTGFRGLDRWTKGGYHEKTLTLYMAETNLGKTLVMTNSVTHNILQNKKILYVTGEMSEFKIDERVISNILDHDVNALETIGVDNFIAKMSSIENSIKGRLKTKEYPTAGFNVSHIRNLLKEYKTKENFVPDILYIDYLGTMQPLFKTKSMDKYDKFKTVSEEVRGLAVESTLPTVSANQSNRDGFNQVELDMTNTADSIGQAFTCDIMFGITQPPEYRTMEPPCLLFQILKNRYGLKHKKMTAQVDYSKMRITEIETQENQQPVTQSTISAGSSVINNMKSRNDLITNERAFSFD